MYKRQVEDFVRAAARPAELDLPRLRVRDRLLYARNQAAGTLRKVFPYIPVSYTHLDVYKRQVDVYVPGCAARPQAIIDGVVKALEILEEKRQSYRKHAGKGES